MYIQYTMDQLFLPMDLEEDIPQNHLVRLINTAVNRLDDAIFDAAYSGGGRDSYHPKMLTKVIIYAYTQRIYSSRQIAKFIRENIPFMWLAGRQRPDFRTINRFRSERMRDGIETVFTAVLQFLAEEKYVSLEHYFLDGTKMEANANRYTFAWGKSVSKHKMKLQENVHALFATIEAQLLKKPKDKSLQKAVRKLRKDLLPRLQKYEQYPSLLGGRNSFSKTDPDATFMRMKEDHMRNGQLKPGYNVQIGTENQFILAYSLHPRPTDTRCLEPHMEKVRQILGKLPRTVIADAGYGSEENYAYLEKEEIQAVAKYGSYHKEKSKAWKEIVGKIENWTYNEAGDSWMCSAGQTLHFRKTIKETQPSGYEIRKRHYRSQNCEGCSLKERCTKVVGNREAYLDN